MPNLTYFAFYSASWQPFWCTSAIHWCLCYCVTGLIQITCRRQALKTNSCSEEPHDWLLPLTVIRRPCLWRSHIVYSPDVCLSVPCLSEVKNGSFPQLLERWHVSWVVDGGWIWDLKGYRAGKVTGSYRVSTTPGNAGYVQEFSWWSWNF